MIKKKLVVIQPTLSSYRLPVYRELAAEFDVHIICQQTPDASFGDIDKDSLLSFTMHYVQNKHVLSGMLFWQKGIFNKLKRIQPDKIFIFSNVHFLSTWVLLLRYSFSKVQLFLHGHGLYKQTQLSPVYRFVYNPLIFLSDKYICYNEHVLNCFRSFNFMSSKITYVNNTIDIPSIVKPEDKDPCGNNIMFIGRLRKGSCIDVLIKAVNEANCSATEIIELHIVGSGAEEENLRKQYNQSWIKWHGKVYDEAKIASISKSCAFGIYPGDAGLSVVHYMALSLVPVVHDCITKHMGPEPAYVINGYNGLLLDEKNKQDSIVSLINGLGALDIRKLQRNSHNTFMELSKPSYGSQLIRIFKDL
jgi:glycosyltransferase involved in cell wall biosynthesis